MKKFTIVIEETVSELFEIEADNAMQAMEIAKEKYKKGEFVLSPGEVITKQMAITSPESEATEWDEF